MSQMLVVLIFLHHKIISLILLFHNLQLLPNNDVAIRTQLRTVSGTSVVVMGSFIDQGFENIALDNENKLSTPRLLCSEVNEINRLNNLPLNEISNNGYHTHNC